MKTRKTVLALLALILVISALAVPAVSKSSFFGDQQYGRCDSCHSALSTMSVTMESSPSVTSVIAPGATVSVWVNVSGSVTGATQVGALISATTGSSNSLPSAGGWTIVSDPSGTSSVYNYYKFTPYAGQHSFRWTLTAPQTTGAYPLYGRILHSGDQEYYKNVGPLTFDVQAVPVNTPQVVIASPLSGASVSGNITVTGTATAATGATIASVVLNIDGAQRGTTTSSAFSFAFDTTTLLNGAHTIQVVATDDGARTGSQSITVTASNGNVIGFVGPKVVIVDPTAAGAYAGSITVSANVTSDAGIGYVVLRINGQQVANTSAAPFSWPVNTANYPDGHAVINITAVDLAGKRGYSEISISIDNAGQDEPLIEMAGTIIAGFLGIVAVLLTLTTAVMFYRNKRGGGA